MPWICASSRPGARVTRSSCSASAAPASSASGRDLEAAARARATSTRRLCPIAGFCKYTADAELLDHSPAVHVRRPPLDYESPATSLDRGDVGPPLVGAGRTGPTAPRSPGLAKKMAPPPLRHAFITAALDTGVPLRDVQEAASHAAPRTTIRYARARVSLDRHATYIVAAYIAGAARQTHPEDAPPGSVLAARRPGDCSSPVARSRSATTGSDTSHDEGSLGAARSSRRGPA